jgi:hypothetical protein
VEPTNDNNIGELAIDGAPVEKPGLIAHLRSAIAPRPRLYLDSLGRFVQADPAQLSSHERQTLSRLEKSSQGLRLMRRLWQEAHERRTNAEHALDLANQRLLNLSRLAAEDGLAREWGLLGTPRPADPATPEHVRVRVLAPFTRFLHRTISPELREWIFVHEQREADALFQPVQYSAIALNHVTDIPVELFDELKAAGLVERAKPGAHKQLPSGERIP